MTWRVPGLSGVWGRKRRTVYAYDALDVRTGETARQAYVGKTSSSLHYRDAQHRADKPWAWAIVGDVYPLWHGECGRIALWIREVYYVVTREPLFNVEWNRRNPHRIEPRQARLLYGTRSRA